MTAHSFAIAFDPVSDAAAQSAEETASDDHFDTAPLQAQLMVCVYARDAAGIRAMFAKSNAEKLIAGLQAPKYFPLHAAALSDEGAVLNALIEALPVEALNVSDASGCTPLMCAARHGHVVAIHTLLAGKARLDVTDQTGYSALMWAAISGFVDAVKVLLSYEVYAVNSAQPAGIDKQDAKGDTALILAIRAGHYDVVDALIERGADINAANLKGERALSVAVSLGRLRVVRLLCERRDVDINAADHEGVNALMRAAEYADWTYDSSILSFLIRRRAEVDLLDHDGCSALLRAAKGKSDIAIEYLIAGGAKLHITDSNGCSAVALAAMHNNLLALRLLLNRRGALIDVRDHRGRTPLFHAVEAANHEVAYELIKQGADVHLRYAEIDATVLTLARQRGDQRMVSLLRCRDANNGTKEAIEVLE